MIREWWDDNGPPLYITASSYLGYKPKPKSEKSAKAPTPPSGNLDDLAQFFDAGGMLMG